MSQNFSYADIEAFAGRFYGGKKLLITPYGYPITFTGLAQNTQQNATLNIAANADFILLSLNHRANTGAAQLTLTKTAPFIRALISDSGSNEQFTNGAVDLESISSNGILDQSLMYPRIIAGRSTLTIQVTNYAPTAETYNVDIFFEGVLVRAYTE